MKGTYIIVAELKTQARIRTSGRLEFNLQPGFYAYVGSAMGGLEGRIRRHLSPTRKLHWHIDYLLQQAAIRAVLCAETAVRQECAVARNMQPVLPSVRGFGCSDCACSSHLFYSGELAKITRIAFEALNGP